MIKQFQAVEADPYLWPFDQLWSSNDTALILAGFEKSTVQSLDAEQECRIASQLVDMAHEVGITIILTRHFAASPDIDENGDREASVVGLTGHEIQFDYSGDNIFFQTGLEDYLKKSSIRNLIFAGLPTDGLVHASQRAANDMGFECLCISDACKGTSPTRHDAQLRITTFGNGLFGAVADAAALMKAIQ